MRYHTERSEIPVYNELGEVYYCNHPVYNRGTLYKKGDKGLVIIQQRCKNKVTYWTEIDSWLGNMIFSNSGFLNYFGKRAGICKDGLYPTVTVRQIMWALKMKPLKKQRWETVFDRKEI